MVALALASVLLQALSFLFSLVLHSICREQKDTFYLGWV